jgi:prevent-host-death family protein
MTFVSIRELSRQAGSIVDSTRTTNRPTIVTKNGKPVAKIFPIAENEIEDVLLTKYLEDSGVFDEAERELAAGETIPAEDVFADLEDE